MVTDEERKIIIDAIKISMSYANGGVRTYVEPDGGITTNYVPFRMHFRNTPFTIEHKKVVLEVWARFNTELEDIV